VVAIFWVDGEGRRAAAISSISFAFPIRHNDAYEEAVKLLQKIRELMGRLDRVTEFEDYLGALCVEYKRKRNFIKLLDTFESL
jgi:uncharacterized Zn finger protein